MGSPAATTYDRPALIDVAPIAPDPDLVAAQQPAGAGPPPQPAMTQDAPPSASPDALSTSTQVLPLGGPPPPPQDGARTPDTPPARRLPPGTVLTIGAAIVVVLVLVIWVLLDRDDPSTTETSGDGSTSTDATEIAALSSVEVPATAENGQNAAGEEVSYAAANLIDGDPTTTWRMNGNAEGKEITVTWPEPVTLTGVGLVNGYAKVDENTGDERYGENRRVLGVTWVFEDDGTELRRTLEETTDVQTFTLDTPVQTSSVTIRINSTSNPGGRDFTAISELSFLGG